MKDRRKFRPDQRLRKQDSFKAIVEKGAFARGRFFYVWAASRQELDTADRNARPALGIVVNRKAAPKAVARNSVKRRVREIFRKRQDQIKENTAILIKAKEGRQAPEIREAEADIMELLKKAGALK